MKFPHLFEFIDVERWPQSIRQTEREVLECGNSKPFRTYYEWVANEVFIAANKIKAKKIVELGAGPAPITKLLANKNWTFETKLIPSDINPDLESYREISSLHPGKISFDEKPHDFSKPFDWGQGALLVLSATLHHLPWKLRIQVLNAMLSSAECVIIFEPVRKTAFSALSVLFASVVVPLLLPLLYFPRRDGRIRRFLLCWLIPVVSICFLWDGVISCLRQWNDKDWDEAKKSLVAGDKNNSMKIENSLLCQKVSWGSKSDA